MTTAAIRVDDIILDPAGGDPAAVTISGDTAPGIRITLASTPNAVVDLGIEQARKVAWRVLALADSLTPANAQGLAVLEVPLKAINDARGTSHTLASLAAACGVDLEHASEADAGRMASYIGGTLMTA